MIDYFKSFNRTYKILVILLIVCIVLAGIVTERQSDKIPIRQASISQLDSVHEIGSKLSKTVYDYIRDNNVTDIDELIVIDGIGEKRIEYLKEVFR